MFNLDLNHFIEKKMQQKDIMIGKNHSIFNEKKKREFLNVQIFTILADLLLL